MLRNDVSGIKRRLNEGSCIINLLYSFFRKGNYEPHTNEIARYC